MCARRCLPYLPALLGPASAYLGDGKGNVSSRPCPGMGAGPGRGSRSRAGVIRVKQRASAPNSSDCSWVVLRRAPARESGWLRGWAQGSRPSPLPLDGAYLLRGAAGLGRAQGCARPLWGGPRQAPGSGCPRTGRDSEEIGALSLAGQGVVVGAGVPLLCRLPFTVPPWTPGAFLFSADPLKPDPPPLPWVRAPGGGEMPLHPVTWALGSPAPVTVTSGPGPGYSTSNANSGELISPGGGSWNLSEAAGSHVTAARTMGKGDA